VTETAGLDLAAATSEHYADAVLYDFEYRRRRADVTFYRAAARRFADGAAILELGCGSGRATIPLVRDGHAVVGIDCSQAMLARASQRVARLGRAARLRHGLIRADMRQLAVKRQFVLVVAVFNVFEHLYTRGELAACLGCVREHLAPGGRLVFDVQNPDLRWLTRDPRKRWARTRFQDPTTGVHVEYTTSHEYESISQIALIRFHYERLSGPTAGTAAVARLAQRKFFPAELEALLAANKFVVDERYGDFAWAPLHGDSQSQVLVCRPRP
jgi:SAM-dependent methyltransferase